MLQDLLAANAERRPEALAIAGPERILCYGDYERETNRLAHALRELGVQPGDRVALWLPKSVAAVVGSQACLRLGAAYVPLDAASPAPRVLRLLDSARPQVLVTTAQRRARLGELGWGGRAVCVDGGGDVAWSDLDAFSDAPPPTPPRDPNVLAYVLYTSGSSGEPKGVCVSHQNALAFVNWAAREIQATPTDHFANHAPLHFDLSVFDVYVALKAGARLSLVTEGLAEAPGRLAAWIEERGVSVWYSVPSALLLMMDYGGLLERTMPELRAVIFAGEPFPMPPLRVLRRHLPGVRMWNFYGPTETNVCTAYEVGPTLDPALSALPIGRAASGDHVALQDPAGRPVAPGHCGEIVVTGPSVMLGYWGEAPQRGPYRTGDLARLDEAGELVYQGRLDQLVKVRGHRIALPEVERVLATHADLQHVAVVPAGEGSGKHLVAMVVPREGRRPGLLSLKRHCAQYLPRSMTVDRVAYVDALPLTRNGKVDRRRLAALLET